MNFLGLCRDLKTTFPRPAKEKDMDFFFSNRSETCSEQEECEAVDFIHKVWQKDGWTLEERVAVRLEKDEDILLHDKGVTIIKTPESLPEDKVLIRLIPTGQDDEQVVWF